MGPRAGLVVAEKRKVSFFAGNSAMIQWLSVPTE